MTLFFPTAKDSAAWIWYAITAVCLFNTFYAYFGYPLFLKMLLSLGVGRKTSQQSKISKGESPTVSLIISARNEEAVIAEKIQNTLRLKYNGQPLPHPKVEIIVASDCSDDRTDEIVREFAPQGVILVRTEQRNGKEAAQKAAVERSTGELIIFSDSKVMLDEELIDGFIAHFNDPEVGAVSSIDRVLSSEGGSGEGFYVRYEMWLRELESEFNGLIGVSGSCFAVRRKIAVKIRTDIPSDFALTVATRQTLSESKRPMIGVHGDGVFAYYKEVTGEQKEFERKVRTVLRGMSALWKNRQSLNPFRFGVFAWQMFSHKLCRWLVPICLVLLLACSLLLARKILLLKVIAAAQILFYVLAIVGYLFPKAQNSLLVKIPLFFTVVNLGIAAAAIKFITGSNITTWNPSEKAR